MGLEMDSRSQQLHRDQPKWNRRQDLGARYASQEHWEGSQFGGACWHRSLQPQPILLCHGAAPAGTPETINEAQPILDELYRFLRPEKPKPEPRRTERKATPGEQAADNLTLTEHYAQARVYIREQYDLIETLEAAGAEKTVSGFSCPFCKHSHTTTLTIAPSGMVGYSHSPLCNLSSEKGFDVTNVLLVKDNYPTFDKLAHPGPTLLSEAETGHTPHNAGLPHASRRAATKPR